jgi:hypothetical protein
MINLKKVGILLLAVGLTTGFAAEKAATIEEKPDATLDITHKSVAIGIGGSWGSGTLAYKGKEYPISVNGMSLGKVGVSKATARGNVYNLKRLKDFDGNYTSAGAGLTLAGGRSAVALKNQHDVKVTLYSTTKGLDVSVGGAGVEMSIKK